MKSLLNEFTPSEDIMELYKSLLKKKLLVKSKVSEKQKNNLDEKIIKLENRISNLQDCLADKQITPSEYNSLRDRYNKEISQVKNELTVYKDDNKNIESLISKGLSMLGNLSLTYESASLPKKMELLSSIFPQKLFFENKKCRTPKLNQAILLFLNKEAGFREKKLGQIAQFLDLSCLVARAGIEPAFPP